MKWTLIERHDEKPAGGSAERDALLSIRAGLLSCELKGQYACNELSFQSAAQFLVDAQNRRSAFVVKLSRRQSGNIACIMLQHGAQCIYIAVDSRRYDGKRKQVLFCIIRQKRFLEDFARKSGMKNIKHFTDDGYTGRNFNRPGFQAMLAEAEAGKIGTIIVKDMSRFGRNYLEVGFYTEILFPKKQIRFVAINNSVDSDKPQDNDFTPFLNIMKNISCLGRVFC